MKKRRFNFIIIGSLIIPILLIFVNPPFSADIHYSKDNTGITEQFSKELKSSVLVWNLTEVVSNEGTDTSWIPSIGTDSVGNVHVVWEDLNDYGGSGTDRDVFYERWNATTGTWTTTEVVSTESTENSRAPTIAVDGFGNVHVAWWDQTNYSSCKFGTENYDIFYKRWNATIGTWTTTEVVSTESTKNSFVPSLVVDSVGNAHVTWYDWTNYSGAGTDIDIFYKYWNATTNTWNITEVVSTESTGTSWFPSLAVDVFGNVHVVWEDQTNYSSCKFGTEFYDTFYKRWNATTSTWTTTEVISTESTEDSRGVSIAMDVTGNAHIVWDDLTDYGGSGSDRDLFCKRWNATTSMWTTTEVVSTESINGSAGPSIVVDGAGNVHLTWHDIINSSGSGTDYDIFYKRWNATSSTWTTVEVVSTESINDSYNPSIAMDGAGNLHVAWNDKTNYSGAGTDTDVFYKFQVENEYPYVSQPIDIITTALGKETINWTLFDDYGGGKFRVWANDTSGNFYVWQNWAAWSNTSTYNVPINRTAPGIFNYTIEYNDTYGLWGNLHTVIVTITDEIPTSNTPSNIVTNALGLETINWTLFDDFGGGQFRVLTNNTSGNFYVWQNWTPWTNTSTYNIPINRSAPGIFNYTIEFNDSIGLWGNSHTVLVNITNGIPTSNTPSNIVTDALGLETINWTLFDDYGGGHFRVLANKTGGTFYVWQNWASWTNETMYYISINRSAPGIFNYTILYNDTYGFWGVAHTVIVTIIDGAPTSNTPSNIITDALGLETINWTLSDDYGVGQFRVRANDTSGNFYLWQNWTSWTNSSTYNIPINRSAPGIFNYTLEFNDSIGLWGVPHTVIVTVTDGVPMSNTPSDIITDVFGLETINWTLSDDYGGGQFRIWANDTSGTFYVWQNWTSWTNSSTYNIPINRSSPGIFNYTIEFNDNQNQFGIQDTVTIEILNYKPTSNTPESITTTLGGSEVLNWVLSDDFDGGEYRILLTKGNNTIVWINWTSWSRGEILEVPIKRETLGTFTYTIEFYDKYNNYGIANSVVVEVIEPEPEFPLLFIILAVVGIVGGVSILGLVSVRKSRRKLRQKELEIESLNKQKANISEEDIILYKEKRFCLVHKGVIEGYNFICPECGSYYCVRCVEALKETDNECWSCGTPLDPSKRVPMKVDDLKKKRIEIEGAKDQSKISKERLKNDPKKAP
jgi:hypothetical protein